MQLAFCLYKYFPFGGLQRDFLRIALACQARGHAIRVYAGEWQGEIPPGFDVVPVPMHALHNHWRYRKYTAWVRDDLVRRPVACVIGFNKMPGLDVYYAADPCYEAKVRTQRNALYRLGGRYRHFAAYERSVFGVRSRTEILMISSVQQPLFERYYGTPAERFHLLPPGIDADRRRPPDALEVRATLRREFAIADDGLLLVQIGSGFRTKGLDRTLQAVASLARPLRDRVRLIVIGQDQAGPFQRQAARLGLEGRILFLKGRNDIPRFLLGADLLVHPAYSENTGTVLLEAVVAGLPVLTTAVCGYAHYIDEAMAGRVVAEPFSQTAFERELARMLTDTDARRRWQANALAFAEQADIYSMPERAAELILEFAARADAT